MTTEAQEEAAKVAPSSSVSWLEAILIGAITPGINVRTWKGLYFAASWMFKAAAYLVTVWHLI